MWAKLGNNILASLHTYPASCIKGSDYSHTGYGMTAITSQLGVGPNQIFIPESHWLGLSHTGTHVAVPLHIYIPRQKILHFPMVFSDVVLTWLWHKFSHSLNPSSCSIILLLACTQEWSSCEAPWDDSSSCLTHGPWEHLATALVIQEGVLLETVLSLKAVLSFSTSCTSLSNSGAVIINAISELRCYPH